MSNCVRPRIAALLLAALLPAAAAAQGGWTEAVPILPPGTVAPLGGNDAAAPVDDDDADSTAEEDLEDEQDSTNPAALRRTRPASTVDELLWIDEQIQHDPYMQTLAAIGPAPETADFYDPFARLRLGPDALRPQVCRYMVQDGAGRVLGQLVLRIALEDSAQGQRWRIAQNSSLGYGEQVDVWQSARSGKPLRVLRRRDFGSHASGTSGLAVREIELFDARYQFDRVNVTKTKGGVTLAVPSRLQFACFDVAQLPVLLQLLDYSSVDWPFEAALFDSTTLDVLPLQVGRPGRSSVMSAEPALCECWEIPVRWADQQLKWFIERNGRRRLVKFEFSGLVFTLQDYAELK